MGSRAVMIVCRDTDTARTRFGVVEDESGVCYTRTGRRFCNDMDLEHQLLDNVRKTLDRTGFWNDFATSWVCLDCELLPWSAKAQSLIREQYAPVGTAANAALAQSVHILEQASGRRLDVEDLLQRFQARHTLADQYNNAYRPYCWPVEAVTDLKLAPFHILATEEAVHIDKTHTWHMKTIARYLTSSDNPCLYQTAHRVVDLENQGHIDACVDWWTTLTESGGEGLVGKPMDFVRHGKQDLVQPAVKCRGREYLRIIYGPEYTLKVHIDRLRSRKISGKRSLALRKFALGIEGLERFIRKEPLLRVHECVFGVLALESEPVDPGL